MDFNINVLLLFLGLHSLLSFWWNMGYPTCKCNVSLFTKFSYSFTKWANKLWLIEHSNKFKKIIIDNLISKFWEYIFLNFNIYNVFLTVSTPKIGNPLTVIAYISQMVNLIGLISFTLNLFQYTSFRRISIKKMIYKNEDACKKLDQALMRTRQHHRPTITDSSLPISKALKAIWQGSISFFYFNSEHLKLVNIIPLKYLG